MSTSQTPQVVVQRQSFLNNVLWGWAGIGIGLLAAFVLSPITVRKLGDANYGLWAVSTALVDYYWLLDFGMRSAIIRFSAHHNAMEDPVQLSRVMSTATAYNLFIVVPLVGGTWWLGPWLATKLMGISNPVFPRLLLVVVISWALTSLFGTFTACLEGFQRFDIINQTAVVSSSLRFGGAFTLLMLGYGVLEMAYITAAAQVLLHVVNYIRLRSLFPAMRISRSLVEWKVFKELIAYGSHSLVSSLGQRVLSQNTPLLAAYFISESFAGYYTNPRQILDYAVEAVARIGNVSNSRASELIASGQAKKVLQLAVLVNRYSLALFLPLAIFLAIYGEAFLLVWIRKPSFVVEAAKVLLALLPGYTIAWAGQYSSGAILFGIGRHQRYARTMVVEAVLSTAGVAFLLPRYGLAAAAAWNSLLMIINRALLTPWLLTRELEAGYLRFLLEVNRPLLTFLPVGAGLMILKRFVPGTSYPQLFLAGLVTLALYIPSIWGVVPRSDWAPVIERSVVVWRKLSVRFGWATL